MKSFFDRIMEWAETHESRPALNYEIGGSEELVPLETKTVTYGELIESAGQWAHAFKDILASQAPSAFPCKLIPTVLIALPAGADFAAAILGALGVGLRVAPISLDLTSFELRRTIAALDPCFAVTKQDYLNALSALKIQVVSAPHDIPAPIAAPHPGQPVTLNVTYKGFGYPLPVSHTAQELEECLEFLTTALDDRVGGRHFVSLPLYPVYGLVTGLLAPLTLGAEILLRQNGLRQNNLKSIVEEGVRVACFVPDMYRKLNIEFKKLPSGEKKSFLRDRYCYFMSGACALPAATEKTWLENTGQPILQGYGTTETLPILKNTTEQHAFGAMGRPNSKTGVKIVGGDGRLVSRGSVGELWVMAKSACTEYEGFNTESSQIFQNGWFRTGDLVVEDSLGFLHFIGNSLPFSKVLGHMVDHQEIIELAEQFPQVSQAHLLHPPQNLGGKLTLLVQLNVHANSLTSERIRRHIAKNLSPHKRPHKIEIYSI